MLQPLTFQNALEALLNARHSPADTALIVLRDGGSIYAQAHLNVAGKSKAAERKPRSASNGNRLAAQQRAKQPGLSSLMPEIETEERSSSRSASAGSAMAIHLTPDERARVLAGTACQAWHEEVARVRRLDSTTNGRFNGLSSSTGPSLISGGSGAAGRFSTLAGQAFTKPPNASTDASPIQRPTKTVDEDDEEFEGVAVPVAILGTPFNGESHSTKMIAPLLLEGELGTSLVLPLHPEGDSSAATLLLVLSAKKPSEQHDLVTTGDSTQSQANWNALHDAAQAFAALVAPSLRKAFGKGGEHLDPAAERAGIIRGAATMTIFSDDRESTSASMEASHAQLGGAGQSGISMQS